MWRQEQHQGTSSDAALTRIITMHKEWARLMSGGSGRERRRESPEAGNLFRAFQTIRSLISSLHTCCAPRVPSLSLSEEEAAQAGRKEEGEGTDTHYPKIH